MSSKKESRKLTPKQKGIIIRKKTSKTKESVKNVEEDTNDNIEIMEIDSDYRSLMKNYDPSKNQFSPVLSDFEMATILGKRATQLAYGAKTPIEFKPGMTLIEVVEEELRQRKTPFMIKKQVGNRVEYWRLDDMEINI